MLPLLEGEGWGEVWFISGKLTHLTLSLSFQERGPVHPARCLNAVASAGEGACGAGGRGGDLSRQRDPLSRPAYGPPSPAEGGGKPFCHTVC
ncbi:hypothetical protein FPV16_14660 [Methylobacterium sp. W2]|nr:hypothetical protein [Methylobacterium sp. W2]